MNPCAKKWCIGLTVKAGATYCVVHTAHTTFAPRNIGLDDRPPKHQSEYVHQANADAIEIAPLFTRPWEDVPTHFTQRY